jgi:excinuclease UvrABC ATPase subunit
MASGSVATISVRGARENNLKGVDLSIPVGEITVFTGVSGSGKSSLVFDTIAAESQRQLNEMFPAFVRNRLPHLGKPDVDELRNLSASIVIDQRPFGGNARSTVGTATDLAPLLRLVWSRVGRPHAGFSNVFSFNQPAGMCPRCQGLGVIDDIDVDELLDRSRSLDEGAITFPTFAPGTAYWKRYVRSGLFDNQRPVRSWSRAQVDDLLYAESRTIDDPPDDWYASTRYEGVVTKFRRLYLSGATASAAKVRRRYRDDFARVVTTTTCPDCGGGRLRPEVLASEVDGRNIADASRLAAVDLLDFLRSLDEPSVAGPLEATVTGLEHMVDVGLGYLALDRVSSTLSGGEAQRVKLVRHLGSSLARLTYVLDEPSVGLHPADVHQLAELLVTLRDKGNTVLVVEHDRDLIRVADHVVDMGPGAGADGGEVVFDGTVAGLERAATATGRYLRQARVLRPEPRASTATFVEIRGADRHNLRCIDVDVPAGVLCVLTGVAGSGKSTLLGCIADRCPDLRVIDQRPLRGGRRSMPVTHLGVLDPLRRAFARANDVGVGWFSPNSDGGCPVCAGTGTITTELAFMDDIDLPCDACGGSKFNDRALSYTLNGHTIADVLATTADAADAVIGGDTAPQVTDAVARMRRCGIGYLTLGQSLHTLSGGERQRLRLAGELGGPATAYAFDEPTTGLHGRDVGHLLALFDELVDDGVSLLVIEHDLDVMAHADWIIDIGPGAGRDGGTVTFTGMPTDLVAHGEGPTAEHLRRWIGDEHPET